MHQNIGKPKAQYFCREKPWNFTVLGPAKYGEAVLVSLHEACTR